MIEYIQKHRNLFLLEGILFIILGLLGIAMPIFSTLATELFIGWLFIIGGAIQAYRTFKAHHTRGFWLSFLTAFLYLIFGIMLISFPLTGMYTLTLFLTIFFFIEGIARIVLAFRLRPHAGWLWLVFNGLVTLSLAIIILLGLPGTALWAIGLLVGINLIFFGLSQIFLVLGTPRQTTNNP